MVIRVKLQKSNMQQVPFVIFTIVPIVLLILGFLAYYVFDFGQIRVYMRILAIVLLFIGWVARERVNISKGELIFLLWGVFLFAINGMQAVNLLAILFMAMCTKKNSEQVTEITLKIVTFLAIIVLLLLFFGFIDEHNIIAQGRVRMGLGFSHPNAAAFFFMSVIFLYLLKKGNSVKFIELLWMAILTFAIYKTTDCRTMIIGAFVLYLLIIWQKIRDKRIGRFFDRVCVFFVDVIFLINLATLFLLDKLDFLNEITSYRIYFFQHAVNMMETKNLFWGNIEYEVDSFYYNLILGYGVITYFLVFCVIRRAVIACTLNKEQRAKLPFIIAILSIGIVESMLMRPELGMVIVFWSIIADNCYSYDMRKKNII